MELADLIDAILDQTLDNELTLIFKRETHVKGDKVVVTIKDNLSDIGYAYEATTRDALKEMQKQLQSFVDEQNA